MERKAAASKLARRRLSGGQDRLSALPDDLLLLILALLPLVEAVRTCVLARRWRPLWTLLQTLHFFDGPVRAAAARFGALVDGVLPRVDGHGVRCLRFVFTGGEANADVRRIASWARFAAQHFAGIHEFHLCVVKPSLQGERLRAQLGDAPVLQLPSFNSAKSISLYLKLMATVAFPEAGTFGALTKLTICRVRFSADAAASPGDVISSRCPCLEELMMVKVTGLDVEAPRLNTFHIENSFFLSNGAAASISAPKLLTVIWKDYCPERTHISDIKQLERLIVGELLVDFLRLACAGSHSNFHRILKHFRRTDKLDLHIPVHIRDLLGHKYLMEHLVLPRCSELRLFVEPNSHMFGTTMLPLLRTCNGLRELHLHLHGRKVTQHAFLLAFGRIHQVG
ncbi:hypothetical protein ACP70R_005681 [Stipagrostis hirtigluma subsp. patula]